jgi:pyruvate formate lyase activating enzyme
MVFGGLQKNSLIDYPGKVCCVLFLSGCNFRCPFCHNPDLVNGDWSFVSSLELYAVYEFLKKRKGFLDGIVISGGEPTIHKELASLCIKIKQIGYSLKLDTNGSRPKIIKLLINEGLVDYVAMDIKTDPFQYSSLITRDCNPAQILESVQVIMESSIAYEFRTTCVKPFVNENIVENIAKIINGAKLYVLQRFYKKRVLRPDFFYQTGAGHDEDELMNLKSIAEAWVKKCTIRT